jgi:hypothetical protein
MVLKGALLADGEGVGLGIREAMALRPLIAIMTQAK